MTLDEEIINAVRILNAEIYDNTKIEYITFGVRTDGLTFCVDFLGNRIWSDDDDDRHYDEESDEHEPLLNFLRRQAIAEIRKIAAIWDITP